MRHVNFTIVGNLLETGEARVAFGRPIREVVPVKGILVVLLSWPTDGSYPQNVFGVSRDGTILWQIPDVQPNRNGDPYVSLVPRGESILVNRWDDLHVLIDPQSGEVQNQYWRKS